MQTHLCLLMENPQKETEQRLEQYMKSAFRHAVGRIVKITRDDDDLTVIGFQITYNKESCCIEVRKITSVEGKKVVLEPPVWTSDYKYDPLRYYYTHTENRVIILEIPAQIPDMKKQLEKIMDSAES